MNFTFPDLGIKQLTLLVCFIALTYTQTPPCTSFDDHFLPHPYDCNRYISCFLGRPFDINCPDNTVHNRCTDLCEAKDSPGLEKPGCGCSACPQNENGRFRSMTRNNCSEYTMCAQGTKLFERTCPSGQFFDPQKGDCFEAASVTGCTIDTCLMTEGADLVIEQAPHPKDCTKYLYCLNKEEITQLPCGPGSIYDVNSVRQVGDKKLRGQCVLANAPNATCFDGMNWCYFVTAPPAAGEVEECHLVTSAPPLFP